MSGVLEPKTPDATAKAVAAQAAADAAQASATAANALAGTKYTKPGSGVPKSDMASAVQTTLTHADTAYTVSAAAQTTADSAVADAAAAQDSADAAQLATTLTQMRTFYDLPDYPTFTKSSLNPIVTNADVGMGSIYTSCLVRVPDSVFAATPQYGRWRLYTSTDHDGTTGGIALIYSNPNVDVDSPMDPGTTWTVYKSGGTTVRFTIDSAVGRQVETPFVVWDEFSRRFFMYYQVLEVSGLQETWVATSPDGLTWTPVQVALKCPTGSVIGDDHTGYARIFNMDGLYVAWHLHGGGAYGGYGYSYSLDGINFVRDRRRMIHNRQMSDGNLRGQISAIFDFRGRPWAVLTSTEFVSGSQTSAQIPKAIAPLSDDLRDLAGAPYYFPDVPQDHEVEVSGSVGNLVKNPRTGKLYGTYRTNGSTGELNVMEVRV